MQEELVVGFGKETRLAVVSALDDVDGQPGHLQALTAWHGISNGYRVLRDDACRESA